MSRLKKVFEPFRKSYLQILTVLLLVLPAVYLMWFSNVNSNQAIGATAVKVRFEGEYRIGDGEWEKITEGKHISATKGDVTLKGNFVSYAPSGEYIGIFSGDVPLVFYTDHIGLTFYENEQESYTIDHENPLYGPSACGVDWTVHFFQELGEEPMEIVVHNPHRFGNETSIDEMLSNIAVWTNIEFERAIMESSKMQRSMGMLFVVIALVLLGVALFSTLLHISTNRIIWLLGMTIFSAGIYSIYSLPTVSFWKEFIATNTILLGFSMMFYMLFISGIITCFLKDTKKAGYITTIILGITNSIYFILPTMTKILFYDTWLPWVITQSAANVVLMICLMKEYASSHKKQRRVFTGMVLLIIGFEVDVIATAMGTWKGGVFSEHVFLILLAATLFVVLRLIPEKINSATKAKELEIQKSRLEAEKNIMEAELKESRISIMLSQIQPHFIYNTLGTIERMCKKDPEQAFHLVRNFSLYLRGNFSELESVAPIRFTEELKHVEYYANIEKVRFPDMNIEYDIQTTDFVLPALSVQPLVENAIKHGLMRLENGGTVVVRSYDTTTHFCVEVKDNGAGFDVSVPVEEKKHVGLRNIRGRLKAMVNGELIVESQIDVGTKAVIMIPKEVIE